MGSQLLISGDTKPGRGQDKMHLANFFNFGSTFSQVPICATNDKLDWETNCRIVKGDYTGVVLPVVLKQSSGKKWTDILRPNSVSMYIVSQRFLELLEKNNIIGWKTYPVTILDQENNMIYGYAGLSVIGRSGPFDYSKSKIFEKQLVPNGTKTNYYKGLYFDLEKWDGSDFFIPEGTLNIIVSEKVMQLIKKFKITNADLQSTAEYEIPEYALPKSS